MSVIVERNGPVTTLVIARPERRNAVDRPTAQALADALREFEADDTARVAVLTGSGGNFCAGADLAAVAEDGERRNRLEAEGDGPMGPSRMQLGKPLIAAIEGYAVAGGLELALLADLRVMAEDAICGVFCRRFGVPLIDGGSVRLPRIVGQGRALDLILTGRPVKADEALQIGLANRVVPSVRREPRPRSWRRNSPPSRRPACSPTAPAYTRSGNCPSTWPWPTNSRAGWR